MNDVSHSSFVSANPYTPKSAREILEAERKRQDQVRAAARTLHAAAQADMQMAEGFNPDLVRERPVQVVRRLPEWVGPAAALGAYVAVVGAIVIYAGGLKHGVEAVKQMGFVDKVKFLFG